MYSTLASLSDILSPTISFDVISSIIFSPNVSISFISLSYSSFIISTSPFFNLFNSSAAVFTSFVAVVEETCELSDTSLKSFVQTCLNLSWTSSLLSPPLLI